MSNNKQSSIEWLIEHYTFADLTAESWKMIQQQVKAMHKEEITHAYHHSWYFRDHPYETAEKYYNETFGGNNE